MASIHPTAVVSPEAELADDVVVGPFCMIGPRVRMGEGCRLADRVTVLGPSVIGRENRFYTGSVIGSDPQDLSYGGEEVWLRMGDRNQVREFATINRGTTKDQAATVIGSDCMFMACTHVAHDCVLGDRVIMANGALLAGHIHVEDGVILNGAAALQQWSTVGRLAYVGGLTRIVQDVPPFMIVEGHPAKVRGVNVIGLRRKGYGDEVIEALKVAHRRLFRSEVEKQRALQAILVDGNPVPEVLGLARFLERQMAGRHGRAREPK
jgi:UDP-N-acetylglucosamine acyltransferase